MSKGVYIILAEKNQEYGLMGWGRAGKDIVNFIHLA